MNKLTAGVFLTFLLAALIAAAGCTASGPSATTSSPSMSTATPAPAVAATAESALFFGESYAKTLDGTNEVLEYVASGDGTEKTEALESFVEAGIVADKFWDRFVAAQTAQQQRTEYGRVDDTRTTATASALAIIREYDANNNVKAVNLQKFEDDFEAMRASYDQKTTSYYAMLPAASTDPATATGAAVRLRKMQADLLVAVSESLEYALIAEPEEMADFNAAMNRFDTQAAAFNATPFLHAKGNEAIAQQYIDFLNAGKEFKAAANSVFSDYDVNKKISPQTISTFEAATDKLRTSYNTLMASVLSKV